MQYKARIRKHLKTNMLIEMKDKQKNHRKIRDICYFDFKTQPYLESHMLNNHEVFLLLSLRSRNAKQFSANFPYNRDQVCPMNGCEDLYTQEHCLNCEKIIQQTQEAKACYTVADTVMT